jgi:hypothetical protein
MKLAMVKLRPALGCKAEKGSLGISVSGDEILVPDDLMSALRAMNVRTGEELYSILADYPQALATGRLFSSRELSLAAADAIERISPLMPSELVRPRQEGKLYRFGAVIPSN